MNPYEAPSTRPESGTSLGRLLLMALIGSAIAWAILLPLFSIGGTGIARPIAEWIAAIPLPGDMPDPRRANSPGSIR